MSNMEVISINWHETDEKMCYHKPCYTSPDWDCSWYDPCECSCYYPNAKKYNDLYFSYVYKQQIYYLRCINGKMYKWIPLTETNGTVYAEHGTNTQISSLLSDSLSAALITPPATNEYPDYSKVDVGKGIKWPKKVFAPFVDATAWPPLKFADLYATTKVPFYNLGFIVSQKPSICYPSWGTYYPAEAGPLNDQIKAIRALGGDVTVSFGGAANIPIHVTAPDATILKEQYKRFVIAYGLTRIDFDIEGPWGSKSYDAANIRNSKALKILQDELVTMGKYVDVWFTLPILPTGLTPDGLNILQLALNEGVTIAGVNVMTMDYGDSVAPDPAGKMGQYGIQAITSLKNQLNTLYKGSKTEAELWAMVGTTPMLGVNDVVSEVFKQSDARETLTFAQSKSIGMISMWSANRDHSAQTGISQSPDEFAIIFNPYNS